MNRKHCDPVPFEIAVSIASIVSGCAGAVALYRTYAPVSIAKSHRRTIQIFNRSLADLGQLQSAIDAMRKSIAIGREVGPQPLWLGSRVFVPPAYFKEYAANADRAMAVLRRILRSTHSLERTISVLPYATPPDVRRIAELQLQIEDLLHSRTESGNAVLNRIGAVVTEVRGLVGELRRELEGR